MYLVTILYNQPADPSAFDDYYEHTHLPLVQEIPNLIRFTACKCEPRDGTAPAAYLLAQLHHESKEAAEQGQASPAGRSASADLVNFATGGITVLSGTEILTLP